LDKIGQCSEGCILGAQTQGGKVTISKSALYVIIAIILVLAGAYILMNTFWKPSATTYDVKVTQYERKWDGKYAIAGDDYMHMWTITIKVINNGGSDVNGAELIVELTKDHTTIASTSESLSLTSGWESTRSVILQAKESEIGVPNLSCIVTIYLGNQILDQYTTTW
jgi:hypothetical protein